MAIDAADDAFVVKIIDFGLSRVCARTLDGSGHRRAAAAAGTLSTAAPEVASGVEIKMFPGDVRTMVHSGDGFGAREITPRPPEIFEAERRTSRTDLARSTTLKILRARLTQWLFSTQVASGAEYTAASDVWSVGCLLYKLVSGRNPFLEDGVEPDAAALRRLNAADCAWTDERIRVHGPRLSGKKKRPTVDA